jgi:hypothetical protein
MKALSGIHSVREGGIKRGPTTWCCYLMTGFFMYLLAIQGNIIPFRDPSSISVTALSFCIPVRSPRQDLSPACSEIGLSVDTVVAGSFGLVHWVCWVGRPCSASLQRRGLVSAAARSWERREV